MKKILVLFTFLTFACMAASGQTGRLQVGLLSDITDTRVVDLSAHPTIRYFLTDHLQISASGLYKKTGYTDTYKYLNLAGRLYLGKYPYFQAGINTNFIGDNLVSLQGGYTSNFGSLWVEPYLNYTGIGNDTYTQVNIGIGVGFSLN